MKSSSKRRKSLLGKKNARPVLLGLGLLWAVAAGLLVIIGCQNSIPPLGTYGAPVSQVNRDLVADFSLNGLIPYNTPSVLPVQSITGPVLDSTGKPVLSYPINPNLFENNNPPTYTIKNQGAVTLLNNFAAYLNFFSWGLYGPGANGAPYGYRVYGTVTDKGDAAFPEMDICAYMESGGAFYDASNFTGVDFYLKVASDDTCLERHFEIPVFQTTAPTEGGGCQAGPHLCSDHFSADVTSGTGGQWEFFRYNFSDLKQLVPGAIPDPPTLSGNNLKQMMWLVWMGARNNKAGTSTVDISVDDVEFFK